MIHIGLQSLVFTIMVADSLGCYSSLADIGYTLAGVGRSLSERLVKCSITDYFHWFEIFYRIIILQFL